MKTIHLAVFIMLSLVVSSLDAHSGRTGKDGCHAGSQPHHCHGDVRQPSSRQSSTGDKERVCVYIYRYVDGSPAYIGISNNPQKRWQQHSDDGRPFASLNKSVTSCYGSRRKALDVERKLIIQNCSASLYNRTHCNQ